jgi:serine phosphatase RsbU (regulator of sigma subunit)
VKVEISPDTSLVSSPFKMLAVLMWSVFAIEVTVMAAFEQFPELPSWVAILLDAATLVVFLFPILYFTVFKPLSQLLDKYVVLEKELIEHRDNLEEMVASRTEQLSQYIRSREEEDELAAYVMERYLNASQSDARVEYSVLSATSLFSGDVVSVAKTPDGGLNVMMLDAMGHGLPAAINVLPAIQAFYSMSKKEIALKNLIYEINDKVRELSPPGRFLAGTFLHLDASGSRLSGWIGGTPKVYVYSEEGILSFSSSNLSLGVVASNKLDFEFFEVPWSENSTLVTCTDGVTESQGADGKDLGENWVAETTRKYGNHLTKAIFDKEWKASLGNNKPHDDASILIVNQTAV